MSVSPLVELIGVTKRFGSNTALSNVSLQLVPGEVHVLLGENGAGKSTLVKTLLGTYQADGGQLLIGGKPVAHHSPALARSAGINVVMQDFSLAPTLSVMDNLFLGREETRAGILTRGTARQTTESLLGAVGASFSPTTEVGNLPRSEQQLVEIMKAIMGQKGVIVFDEPTAALGESEAERLFTIVDRLAAEGWAVLYITHRMAEIRRLGTHVTVLRDGKWVASHAVDDVSDEQLVREMVGREITSAYPQKARADQVGEQVLELDRITSANRKVREVSLNVCRGEIVAVAGLVGAGKGDILRVLAGTERIASGNVSVGSYRTSSPNARSLIKQGVGFMPEDRKTESLALQLSVHDNLTLELTRKRDYAHFGLLAISKLKQVTDDFLQRLEVRPRDPHTEVSLLSGGNQQKVVLARALTQKRDLFVVSEPTSGVDVGARQLIYQQLRNACDAGAGILMISSDMEEVIGLSDRVYVMNSGQIVSELRENEITDTAIVNAAFGGGSHDA